MKFFILAVLLIVGGYLYLNPGVIESIVGKTTSQYQSSVEQNRQMM